MFQRISLHTGTPAETPYDNWTPLAAADLKNEWATEWYNMRRFLRTGFFDDETRMVEFILKHGKVMRLSRSMDMRMARRSHCKSVEQVEEMVADYGSAARRKGVPTALAKAMQENKPLPMPLVMRRFNQDWIVGGNTRLDIAEILGVHPDPKITYVDLTVPGIEVILDRYPPTPIKR